MGEASGADDALLDLLRALKAQAYHFVTPTPATHGRVLARPDRTDARTIEDVFGWSLPFAPDLLTPELIDPLRAADMVATDGSHLRSRVRVSALRNCLYLHSAYPTDAPDAVFLGPDSYRFADLIVDELAACAAGARIIDVGCGAGVGAIVAAQACPDATVTMTDINPAALRLARINAAAASVSIAAIHTTGLDGIDGPASASAPAKAGILADQEMGPGLRRSERGFDVVTLNPPYIVDGAGRTYRDGGGMHGAQLSLDLACAGMERLAPQGRVILYTGSAIIRGADPLRGALTREGTARGCTLRYREIDPDVFGEELDGPAYADVDRIALVAAILTRA